MEWVILFGILVCVLLVIYGRLREELNKGKQIKSLKKQIELQNELAKRKDKELLNNAPIDDVVGFLNRVRSDDKSPD